MLAGLSSMYVTWMTAAWVIVCAFLFGFVRFRLWKARGRLGRLASRVLLLVIVLAWSLLLAETLFVWGYSTTDAFSLSLVSKRWNERFVERNNWNCRDSQRYVGAPPSGMRRVTIMGDSFAFGHGIKNIRDRFGEIVADRLQNDRSEPWEMCNLAEPGANTGWQADRLEKLTKSDGFSSDILMLAYCLNDIEDLNPRTYEIVGSIINDPPKDFVCQNFFLPNFLYYRLHHFRRPEVRGYFGWLEDAYRGDTWDQQKLRLQRIERWCADRQAKLVVVIFPFMSGFERDYTFEYAHHVMVEYFSKRNIPCLDLLQVFRQHPKVPLTVNPFDSHPNEHAHRIAADAIWTTLLKPALER